MKLEKFELEGATTSLLLLSYIEYPNKTPSFLYRQQCMTSRTVYFLRVVYRKEEEGEGGVEGGSGKRREEEGREEGRRRKKGRRSKKK